MGAWRTSGLSGGSALSCRSCDAGGTIISFFGDDFTWEWIQDRSGDLPAQAEALASLFVGKGGDVLDMDMNIRSDESLMIVSI